MTTAGLPVGALTAASTDTVQTRATTSGIDDTPTPIQIQRKPLPPRSTGTLAIATCLPRTTTPPRTSRLITITTPMEISSKPQVSATTGPAFGPKPTR